MKIIQIVAVDKNGMMAKSEFNGIPWRCSSDMKRFKEETTGHNVIMGRKTFDSIGRALPNRNNIVLTKNTSWKAPDGVLVAYNIATALSFCDLTELNKNIYIIGGAQIYSAFKDITTDIHYTEINVDVNGDIPYPVDLSNFNLICESYYTKGEKDDGSQIVKIYNLANSDSLTF